jgi:hypothetical protein
VCMCTAHARHKCVHTQYTRVCTRRTRERERESRERVRERERVRARPRDMVISVQMQACIGWRVHICKPKIFCFRKFYFFR